MGALEDGTKDLVAIHDGERENITQPQGPSKERAEQH